MVTDVHYEGLLSNQTFCKVVDRCVCVCMFVNVCTGKKNRKRKRRSKLENIDKAGIQKMSHLTPTHRNSGTAPNNPPAFQFSFPIGLAALWDERFINHKETKQCPFTADSWHCISDLLNGKVVDSVHLLEIKNRDWWGDQTSVVVFSRTQSVCTARQTFVPHRPCLHLCATCWARRHLSLLVPAARATLATTIWWMSAWLLPPWHRMDGQVVRVPPLPQHPLFLITRMQIWLRACPKSHLKLVYTSLEHL